MNTKKDEFDETLKNIFDGVIAGAKRETEEKFKETIDALEGMDYVKDCDDYDTMVRYKWGLVLDQYLSRKYPKCSDIDRVTFIYNNYAMVERIIQNIIDDKEGMACCADKSRHMVIQYEKYWGEGKEFKVVKDKEEHYWHTKLYTNDIWLEFIEGFYSAYYGKLTPLLEALKKMAAYEKEQK